LIIGPAIAGILVASFGGPSVLLIDAGTFAVMALVASTLPVLKRSEPLVQAPLLERLGLHQLWNMKVVRITTLLSLVFFFSYGPLEAALPLYSKAILQTDARGYGLLWSALAVGALIGTLSSTTLSRRLRLGVALPLIALLWGASLLPMVFINDLWLACAFLLLGGLMWGPYTPMETTLLQRNVPKAQLGRVFGARSLAHRWIASRFGNWWHTAEFCTFNQCDRTFSYRLYHCWFRRPCITNLPRFVASTCGLQLLNKSCYERFRFAHLLESL